MKTKQYVITGLITYIFFLFTTLPAATVIGLLGDSVPQISMQGVSGTIWNGSARRITISSKHVIDNVNWSVCSWRLLTAEACVELDASYRKNSLQGQIGVGITGSLVARDFYTEIDAQSLGDLAGLPIGKLDGLVSIQLESVNWTNEQTPSAVGKLHWKNAAVTIAETAKLGDVEITLIESDDFPLMATIKNKGGQININGESHVSDDGNYISELKLTPNDTTSNNLRSSLALFAKLKSNGTFVVKNTGNLKQLGIM